MYFIKKRILINGIDTSYEVSGAIWESKTLVFLHGWGQNMNSFRDIFTLCKKNNIPYITLDLPGFGGTSRPKETWGVRDYASFVKVFLEKVGISEPIIIGHSFGGRIAISLWGENKNLLSGIVLIGSAGIQPIISLCRVIISNIVRPILAIVYMQKVRSFLRKKFGSVDYLNAGNMTDIFRKIISEDLQSVLSRISIETLLIWGEKDTETPVLDGKIMEREIQNSKLITFPEWTHFVFQEFSEETFEYIQKFRHSL